MINWLTQTIAAHPDLACGQAPEGLLGADETAVLHGLKVLKRRRDWLLGRWTAKHLLQEMISQDRGQRVALERIAILPGQDGAPVIRSDSLFNDQDSPYSPYTVSISHAHGTSFCAALAHPDWPLGADIERIESRPANFAASYFSEQEQAQIKLAAPEMNDALLTAVWSAKEAVLKAIHKGLRVDTRSVSCLIEAPAELPRAWRPFRIKWERELDGGHFPDLNGWWMVSGCYVLTLVAACDQGSLVFEKANLMGMHRCE